MSRIKSRLFDIFMVLWTVMLGSLTLPYLMLFGSAKQVRAVSRLWSGGLLWGMKHIVGLTYQEIGTQNKSTTPAIYVSNHQSIWETLVFNVLIPDVAIVLKDSLLNYPIFGWFLKRSPMIPIDRGSPIKAFRHMRKTSREVVEDGRSILIFPEGTRQDIHKNAEFRRGIEELSRALRLPIIPVALNSGVFWRPGQWMKHSGTITVSYLAPVDVAEDRKNLLSDLRQTIHTEKNRLIKGVDMAAKTNIVKDS